MSCMHTYVTIKAFINEEALWPSQLLKSMPASKQIQDERISLSLDLDSETFGQMKEADRYPSPIDAPSYQHGRK